MTVKTDQTLRNHGLEFSILQKKYLDKYHSSMALKSHTGSKLAVKTQRKLLGEVQVQLEKRIMEQRKAEEMKREAKDYWEEQKQLFNEKMLESVKKYFAGC